jgi:dTDP-glucose pyrophosphorylase
MWGIVTAAGQGSSMQPLAFSKELLPVGSRAEGDRERPRAVSEYLVERLVLGGADLAYVVQPEPAGLCDALFRAAPLIGADEPVAIGLPDTVWFPEDALASLPPDELAFLLFPVVRPELFDAVALDARERVVEIRVKQENPGTSWIWGAFRMPGRIFHDLHRLWLARGRSDEYIGTLVNAWIADGGVARGCKAGSAYFDVGTLHGYRAAMQVLAERDEPPGAARAGVSGAASTRESQPEMPR